MTPPCLFLLTLSLLLCNAAAITTRPSLRTNTESVLDDGRHLQQGWKQPAWWLQYRKKFKKRRLKRCMALNGKLPKNGAVCQAFLANGWYMCMYGDTQTCTPYTGPLTGMPGSGYNGTGLGNIHPTTRCTCQDGIWNCDDWKPCDPPPVTMFRTTYGGLESQLPFISKDVLNGYKSVGDIEPDLLQVATFYAIQIMKSQRGVQYIKGPFAQPFGRDEILDVGVTMASPTASGQTDFETNNQEQGVDEADAVKSDGTFVYAAYGDVLLVWNALTGVIITNITMPAINGINQPIGSTSFRPMRPEFFYQSTPMIKALLLESDRLVVVVDGYGYTKHSMYNLSTTVLNDAIATNVRVYDTSSLSLSGELTFIKEVDINGAYRDARAIGENIHIVTSSGLNTWEWLSAPLQKWSGNFAEELSEEDYILEAGMLATEKLIPAFVQQLMTEINMFGTPTLVAVSLWESVLSGMEEYTFGDGVIQAYTQVTSFAATDPQLTLSLAGSFMPTTGGYTYSNEDMLIISAEGWDFVPTKNATGPTTYFLGMKLEGAKAMPAAIGSLPGRLLNQYSLDFFEGHLRAATNTPNLWQWPTFDGTGFVPPILVSANENQVVILKVPSTGNSATGVFTEVSRISKLGKEEETFTAVRFFDNVAYAVTFFRKDPFYVLDLNVENPRVLGELEITGFSSYLHAINDNNTLILAIGEEADATGRILGIKISLFDSTDPTTPTLLQSHVVEEDRDTWSSSAVSWDFKAFRYLQLAPEVGILILPVQVSAPFPSTEGNFDGFITYDVSREGISERGSIPHVSSDRFYGCYGAASLPQRSLVFNGNVTTLKGHSVISTDLDTLQTSWELQLDDDVDEDKAGICYFWFF